MIFNRNRQDYKPPKQKKSLQCGHAACRSSRFVMYDTEGKALYRCSVCQALSRVVQNGN